MISPFAPLNLPPIENPLAMLPENSTPPLNLPVKQPVKQDTFIVERKVTDHRDAKPEQAAPEPVTKRRKLDDDHPIDIVIDNPEKRQRLDSKAGDNSKSIEGKLRNEIHI